MDSNTQKGCMIGCLASVGIFIGIAFGIFLLFALAIRGCTQVASNGGLAARANGVENRPKDEEPFRKVWLEGRGGAKAANILKIRLHGVISSSIKYSLFDPTEDTSAPAALRKIRAAAKDRSIRGIYLDIDSPGGGVTISDELHDAVARFRASGTNRFVFVHMGDLCCSGGYYVAAPATWIMARPTTITGSIGVMMNSINIAGLAQKIGLEDVTIASGGNKDLLNPFKPVDTNHVAILERPIRQLYDRFVGIVAKGRNMPEAEVRKLADGRVFSAEDALKNGLVDGIGYEEDAKQQLKKMAGCNLRIYGYREKPNFRSLFENSLLFESADGLWRRLKAALDDDSAPRAEYRLR